MSIYTKTGDDGETGLFGGGRVSKGHPRVTACGEVDELNSAIGVSMACAPEDFQAAALEAIQRDLFAIGGQLATPDPQKVAKAMRKAELSDTRIAELEAAIDHADGELPPLEAFILPGGTAKAVALHFARAVCRRAERQVVTMAGRDPVPHDIIVYLNRLSDLLFTWARLANHLARVTDRTW